MTLTSAVLNTGELWVEWPELPLDRIGGVKESCLYDFDLSNLTVVLFLRCFTYFGSIVVGVYFLAFSFGFSKLLFKLGDLTLDVWGGLSLRVGDLGDSFYSG